MPVVTGEFDQGYDCAGPPTSPAALTTFDNTFMNWADADGVSYLAWGWWVLGNTSTPCSALGDPGDNYALISDYDGAAVASGRGEPPRPSGLPGRRCGRRSRRASLPAARVQGEVLGHTPGRRRQSALQVVAGLGTVAHRAPRLGHRG